MVLLIPLINTPTLSNAAESTPVSVSIEPAPHAGSAAISPSFLLTVEHSDGSLSTGFIIVKWTDELTDELGGNSIKLQKGKLSEVPNMPGVMIGSSGEWDWLNQVTISDAGYEASSVCFADRNIGDACLTTALKNKPQTGTQVVQMPTTGAPEGLTMAGVSALGIGVAGLLAAAVRRRA